MVGTFDVLVSESADAGFVAPAPQTQIRQIGPGMLQQMQSKCSNCSGTGSSCPSSDRCDTCNGDQLVSNKKTFEVHIDKGMKNGSKVYLRGEAGCSEPGLAPGDIILVVQVSYCLCLAPLFQAFPAASAIGGAGNLLLLHRLCTAFAARISA